MEALSKVCAVVAGILMFTTPVLFVLWLVRLIAKKSAKVLGITCLICAGCFMLSVIVGAFSDPSPVDGAKYLKASKVPDGPEGTEVVETKKTYEQEVKSFSSKRKVSLELAQSIKDALEQPDCPFTFEEINGWEQTEDWAFGERYQAWHYDMHADKYYYALIYTQNDQVVSVYDTTDGRKLVYECEAEKQPAPALDEGSIFLTDGVLGEYGKEVTIPSQTYGEYTYTWYVVPYGKYEVVNNSRLATVFVVSDKDSNDVRCTLQFQSSGETGEIVVEEGTHIELSMNAEVILTAK